MIRELTSENFASTIATNPIVFAFFWNDDGYARTFWPVFDNASGRHRQLVFGSVDIEQQPKLVDEWDIGRTTLMVFRDGQLVVASNRGPLPWSGLDRLVEDAEQLDMANVRRRVAEYVRARERR